MQNEKAKQSIALYLTFRLDQEMFSLDVSQVREVLEVSNITRVPRAPEYMRGVINVRGAVVPVVDLRTKFGLDQVEDTQYTRIIVMELELDGEDVVLGALADSVHEVVELDREAVEAPPKIGARWRSEYIKGIGKRDGGFILILDIDRVFTGEELAFMDQKPAEETEAAA